MAANLEDVPSLDLMHELLRRMKCSSKPDKRLILIGPPGCRWLVRVAFFVSAAAALRACVRFGLVSFPCNVIMS
uniref:Uncharacterized protein n=1 Tax=Zea mays TaxID=4577 RepID=B6TCW2_MAIZE|nr:hypothetical protein [Zea mays]